jgi:hypothetical protein
MAFNVNLFSLNSICFTAKRTSSHVTPPLKLFTLSDLIWSFLVISVADQQLTNISWHVFPTYLEK